jgi:hypothetical protein
VLDLVVHEYAAFAHGDHPREVERAFLRTYLNFQPPVLAEWCASIGQATSEPGMHTIIVIGIGLVLLGVCTLVGRMFGGRSGSATASLVFLPLWLFGAGINMFIGVKRAGYSVAAETPIFLIVFAVPAAAALLVWYRLR